MRRLVVLVPLILSCGADLLGDSTDPNTVEHESFSAPRAHHAAVRSPGDELDGGVYPYDAESPAVYSVSVE